MFLNQGYLSKVLLTMVSNYFFFTKKPNNRFWLSTLPQMPWVEPKCLCLNVLKCIKPEFLKPEMLPFYVCKNSSNNFTNSSLYFKYRTNPKKNPFRKSRWKCYQKVKPNKRGDERNCLMGGKIIPDHLLALDCLPYCRPDFDANLTVSTKDQHS